MIRSISISNFGGIENAQFDCSKFNIFQGNSEQGKSSFLQAIAWCICGNNDEHIIRIGTNTVEVLLYSDNGSRLERRLTRVGTSKFFVYNKMDAAQPRPQEIANKLFNPLLFSPSKMVEMAPKELNAFIAESIGKRIKFTDEQINLYKLDKKELEASEDPIEFINKHYKTIYDKRTEINRTVKNMSAKMSGLPTQKVDKKEVDELEVTLKSKKDELEKALEHNTKIEISKKNQIVKENTKQTVEKLQTEINAAEDIGDTKDLEELLKSKKETLSSNKSNLDSNRAILDNIAKSLNVLNVDKIVCPLNAVIVCNTELGKYKEDLEKQQLELKQLIKTTFGVVEVLDKDIKKLEKNIETAKDIKQKKLELERAKAILEQFDIFDGEPINIDKLRIEVNELQDKLSKLKLALELGEISGLDDAKKRQEQLDIDVKNIDDLIKNKITDMLKINIKGVTINKDGIFYNELPLYRLADSVKLRLCTAILKDLFPSANLYCLDGLEKIDKANLIKYVERNVKDDKIQYFGTLVGSVDSVASNKCKVFMVNNFKLSE